MQSLTIYRRVTKCEGITYFKVDWSLRCPTRYPKLSTLPAELLLATASATMYDMEPSVSKVAFSFGIFTTISYAKFTVSNQSRMKLHAVSHVQCKFLP